MTCRLLVTMRDMAAAAHLAEVLRALAQDSRFDAIVVAQEPAARLARELALPHRTVDLAPAQAATDANAVALRAEARRIIADVRPDAVLVGLSTPFDGGIDEAMLAEATVPTFLLQDFWGEQNKFFGKGAGTVLVVDDLARAQNRKRFGIDSIVVGSASHAAYARLDISGLRSRLRQELRATDETIVVGYFGQALHRLAGYRRTVVTFLDALSHIAPKPRLVLRPHPRESESDRQALAEIFRSYDADFVTREGGSIDHVLPGCDVVCTIFSKCIYDTAYLNYFSSEPIATTVALLFDEEIAGYCHQFVDFDLLPARAHGLVTPVYRREKLPDVLRYAATPQARQDTWCKAKTFLPNPVRTPSEILNVIERCVMEAPRRGSVYDRL